MGEQIENLTESIKVLTTTVSSLATRIEALENSNTASPTEHDTSQTDEARALLADQQTQSGPNNSFEFVAADVQRDFERLRDSLLRVPVPNDLKVRDSATGIKQDCKPALKIIQKCARYAEVLLKILKTRDHDTERENVDKIFTCAVAQITFLQAEFANLVVKSSFDENTSRLFRQFENSASVFNEQSLNSIG